jgi:hypothetical protein
MLKGVADCLGALVKPLQETSAFGRFDALAVRDGVEYLFDDALPDLGWEDIVGLYVEHAPIVLALVASI